MQLCEEVVGGFGLVVTCRVHIDVVQRVHWLPSQCQVASEQEQDSGKQVPQAYRVNGYVSFPVHPLQS